MKDTRMVTSVGTESSIQDLMHNLLWVEHGAIAAYESNIEKLESHSAAMDQIAQFRGDHMRHVAELEKMAAMLGIEAPHTGDAKQWLMTGEIALAGLMGDSAILKAMRTNEDDTVTAYERASTHADAMPESRGFFQRFAADERRHRAWMEQAAMG